MSGRSPTPPSAANASKSLRIADLAADRPVDFALHPSPEERSELALSLAIPTIRKLRFVGQLIPVGARDWQLKAELGATVVQECVATLAPVTTRIDEPVTRTYLADPTPDPTGEEVEMPEDDSQEPLPAILNLDDVMAEALALALPAYPRADGAEIGAIAAAPDGADPTEDLQERPFAGLAALRDRLGETETD